MDELDKLLKPSWGTEKWILEGWNKITHDEKMTINVRVKDLFKDGLPFVVEHDKLLYIYVFSLMAQLEVLGIQLPLRFEDKMQNPVFKKRMRAQLVDEIFHAIVFTKVAFLLCAPYDSPPAYTEQIDRLCQFFRSQDCIKVSMVVMNLVCEGLVEEVFSTLHKQNIAPELFAMIMEDEHRHVCEADLYAALGLPDRTVLAEALLSLEELLIAAFTFQPKYTIALSALLGPQGTAAFIVSIHEKYTQQLKKINMVPSEKWEIFFSVAPNVYAEIEPYSEELNTEANLEIYEVEMTPTRKALMTQLSVPGDPTMVAQFNMDISDFCFFEEKYPSDTLTVLMMQSVSRVLESHASFRHFISYKKLYISRGAYVSVVEKLPDCGDHIGTVSFKDCHEMTTQELSIKIKRAVQMMVYCFKKREQIEKEHPELKRRLDDMLYDSAHDIYPCPTPGSHGVYLSNLGLYGYTQAISPLLKQTGLHILLLAVERKPVWNNATQSFVAKDLLPVSISADNRIFDGMLPIPDLLNKAFQTAFQEMKERIEDPLMDKETTESNRYRKRIDQIADEMLAKRDSAKGGLIIAHLINKNKNAAFKEVRRVFGDDLQVYGEPLTMHSDYKNIADNLLLDYLGFNADEAARDANFTKIVDKMLSENLELGYRVLAGLQNVWVDYIDIETVFNSAYKKIAGSRLGRLAPLIPNIVRRELS